MEPWSITGSRSIETHTLPYVTDERQSEVVVDRKHPYAPLRTSPFDVRGNMFATILDDSILCRVAEV